MTSWYQGMGVGTGRLMRVDGTTGDRSVLASDVVGSGPSIASGPGDVSLFGMVAQTVPSSAWPAGLAVILLLSGVALIRRLPG